MTFLDPQSDPLGLGAVTSNNPTSIPPIIQNLPNAQKSYARKYTPAAVKQLKSAFDPNVVDSFLAFEQKRVAKGQYPLTATQAVQAMASAQKNHAATPAPDRDPTDILGNVASDVGDIVTSIPQMPSQIAHDILNAPKTAEALASGDLARITEAPIIRLIPGAFTAHNLVTGNLDAELSHPVMSALDVAPYAKAAGLSSLVEKVPVPGEAANVGELASRAKGVYERSTAGQMLSNAFGSHTRDLMRTIAINGEEATQRANPAMATVYDDNLSHVGQQLTHAGNQASHIIADPQREAALVQAYERGNLDALNPTDAERGAVQLVSRAQNAAQQHLVDTSALAQRQFDGTTETLLPNEAAKIDKARAKFSHHETLASLNSAISDPTSADLATLAEQVKSTLTSDTLSVKAKKDVAAGYVHALDRAGYDTGTALADVQKFSRQNLTPEGIDAITQSSTPPEPTEAGTVATRVRRRTGLARDRYVVAAGKKGLESADRWVERNAQYTPKSLETARNRLTAKEQSIVPARWQPIFQDMKVDKARGYIEQNLDPASPEFDTLMSQVHDHVFTGLDPKVVRGIDAEIKAEIPRLRAQGVDPQFVHHISRDQLRSLNQPTMSTMTPTPTQLKSRINDWTPHVDSFSASMTHQAAELLHADQTRTSTLPAIRDNFTTTFADAEAELAGPARRAAARSGLDYHTELERLMRKKYQSYDETERGFLGGKKLNVNQGKWNPDTLLIPRYLAHALDQMAHPPVYSRVLDPITKAFRYSVLPFSPRFHINNTVGGAIMTALEDPTILAKTPAAFSIARDLDRLFAAQAKGNEFTLKPDTIDFLKNSGPEIRGTLQSLKYGINADDLYKLRGGGQMAKWAQDAGVDRLIKGGADKFKAAVDWSMNKNELIDNMYRIASYLTGRDRELGKGMSPVEADAAGFALAQKTVPRWLEMTPMERSVLRAVFPFYSFMNHIFRYAARYPIDHPWRTSVMGGLARAELTDFGTGLPQMLHSLFFLGSPDAKGNQNAIDIGASNPFRDFGDQLTLAGFLGQTNPVFKAALREVGYDPDTRSPNLYPDTIYDPQTGTFKQANPNAQGLLGQFVTDIIPQAKVLGDLLGTSSEFKQLLRTNPGAAQRMLLSNVGIPSVYKSVPVYPDAFKGEINRQTAQSQVWSRAMKTGDYSQAWNYPQLRPTIRALQAAQRKGLFDNNGSLAKYVVGAANPYIDIPNNGGNQTTTQAELAAQ